MNTIYSDTSFYVAKTGILHHRFNTDGIKVVDMSFFSISNAFTPNNDGKNDRLPVNVTGYIELKCSGSLTDWDSLDLQHNH